MKNAFLFLSFLLLTFSARADIVVNEVNYNPPGSSDLEEFIELYNTGDETVSLAGWEFDKGVDFVFPEGAKIVGKGYAVDFKNRNVIITAQLTHFIVVIGFYAR